MLAMDLHWSVTALLFAIHICEISAILILQSILLFDCYWIDFYCICIRCTWDNTGNSVTVPKSNLIFASQVNTIMLGKFSGNLYLFSFIHTKGSDLSWKLTVVIFIITIRSHEPHFLGLAIWIWSHHSV